MESVKSAVVNRVPVLKWGPQYNSKKLVSDTIAGFTVGLTVMPQALAYATLGGLEPQVSGSLVIITQEVFVKGKLKSRIRRKVLAKSKSGTKRRRHDLDNKEIFMFYFGQERSLLYLGVVISFLTKSSSVSRS